MASRPTPYLFSRPLDFEKAFETMTSIKDTKGATGPQNETTTVLSYHVMPQVEGADSGDEGDSHRTLAVIEALIPEGLVHRIFEILPYVT